MNQALLRPLWLCVALASLAGCTLGPDYQRPETAAPVIRQEPVEGWKVATPADLAPREDWWTIYQTPSINALMVQLESANQSLQAADAQYRQARALVARTRSELFPQVGSSASAVRSSSGANSPANQYSAGLNASWELDVWGRVRRSLESNRAQAESSAAQRAAVKLSLQSELAVTFLQLATLDRQIDIYDRTLQAYQRALQLTKNKYEAGVVRKSDVIQAETQLYNTQATRIDLNWQRAQAENAIAVLTGQVAGGFSVPKQSDLPTLPAIPDQLPADLLERRPDVAAAERKVMAANAQIGVAETAWFPTISLGGGVGYNNDHIGGLISSPNRYWSLGPQAALTLLDFGGRKADLERNEAAYDQTVAEYRQTVLQAIEEIENNWVQLRVLSAEESSQLKALESAQEALRLMELQYKAGTVDYLDVINLQTTMLNTERAHLALRSNRLAASMRLMASLGGGWNKGEEVVVGTQEQ